MNGQRLLYQIYVVAHHGRHDLVIEDVAISVQALAGTDVADADPGVATPPPP